MKIAVIAPVAWRTPPRHYGPWEQFASLLADGLTDAGAEVTLYATGDSITKARLRSSCRHPYEEDEKSDAKVCEYLHISRFAEEAGEFDIIHNGFDFMPLAFSRLIRPPMVTTIHGFSSPKILPLYQKYDSSTYYVSISNSNRSPALHYIRTVYHGIHVQDYRLQEKKKDYLLFLEESIRIREPVRQFRLPGC